MSSSETGSTVTLVVLRPSGVGSALTSIPLASAAEKSFSINREAGSIATDAKGDTSVTNTPGRQNVICSVECLYVHSNTAQQRLITLMKTNAQVSLEIHRDSTAFQSATGTITSLNIVHADLEAATFSAEFDVDGDFA